MSRIKIAVALGAGLGITMLASLAAIQTVEDTELRGLDVTGWDCYSIRGDCTKAGGQRV
jgi:hypothetical protein